MDYTPTSSHGAHAMPYSSPQSSHNSQFTRFVPNHLAIVDREPSVSRTNTRPQLAVQPTSSPHQPSHHALQPAPSSSYEHSHHTAMTPLTPIRAPSPQFPSPSPRQQTQQLPSYVPSDRKLPSIEQTTDTIDDAFASFILYCNPSFPLSTDTAELVRCFRAPPRSDGKSFSTWDLFELIRKLELKEIKTWTQLALDLGVGPPDLEKGQSTQKVQQYTVRLKRWMRAMHIDAFFEYLLGKQHIYFLQIPHPSVLCPEGGRDGVPLEEDLSVRALDPTLRPKRGRKKAEDEEEEDDPLLTPSAPKRPQLDTNIIFRSPHNQHNPPSAYPSSAVPMSAFPDDYAHDPWAASGVMTPASLAPASAKTPHSTVSAPPGTHIRWRLDTQQNPITPHPLSVVTPSSGMPPDSAFDEPQSAVTPATKRARRRHGPAVSSAWPSNSGSATGKLRGRPPSNRSVRDGPFVTFPANPNTKEAPTIDMNRSTPGPTPIRERASSESSAVEQPQHFGLQTPISAMSTQSQPFMQLPQTRPERLSLRVPQHVGGPVHLVTPTVLVNGQSQAGSEEYTHQRPPSSAFMDSAIQMDATPVNPKSIPLRPGSAHGHHRRTSSEPTASQMPVVVTDENIKRAVAADLLRADITGRRKLRGADAKSLAESLLSRLRPKHNTSGASDISFLSTAASCLGVCSRVGLGEDGPSGRIEKITVQRYRVRGDGYDSPIDDDDGDDAMSNTGADQIRETFDVQWVLHFGDAVGEFSIKGLTMDAPTNDGELDGMYNRGHESLNERNMAPEVLARFKALEARLQDREKEVQRLKDRVLEAVL